MADVADLETVEVKKGSKMPMIIGLVLALLGGGGGFYAVSSGLILAPESKTKVLEDEVKPDSFSEIVFIPLDPLTVSLPASSKYSHLKFRAELEVSKSYKSDVEMIKPRVIDVLNGYLRALDVSDIEEAASLTRLRSQMLRRVQVVAGPGRINDLLIMEFVLN